MAYNTQYGGQQPPYQQGPPPYPTQQPPPYPQQAYPAGQPAYNPSYGQQPPPQPGFVAQPVYVSGYATSGGEYGGQMPDQGPKDYALSFDNASIRRGFIRKVFGIVTVQLIVVVLMIALFLFQEDCNLFVKRHSWVYWISYVVFLITYIALMCCDSVRRSYPANVILTALLTFAIGYMTAMISSFYRVEIVLIAMGICALCCFSIIIFSIQTKYDFTKWIGVMFVIFICVFLFGIIAIIVLMLTQITFLYLIYAGLMALVFMVFLAIDIQMIMGGKKHEISPEESIYAAIQLFLDIIYIFWFILQIVGSCSR